MGSVSVPLPTTASQLALWCKLSVGVLASDYSLLKWVWHFPWHRALWMGCSKPRPAAALCPLGLALVERPKEGSGWA